VTQLELRDALLESLRTQFRADVRSIALRRHGVAVLEPSDPRVDEFLRNVANNMAQGLVEVTEDDEGCAFCEYDDTTHSHAPNCRSEEARFEQMYQSRRAEEERR